MPNLRVKLWRELNDALDTIGEPECRTSPDLFDLDLYTDPQTKKMAEQVAKEMCSRCPAKTQCVGYALVSGEEAMVWGGLTPAEREGMKNRQL
jgi:WhiB family redox-sensing transcriptional regulator